MEPAPGERRPHVSDAEASRFARFRESLAAEGLSAITLACYASDWWNLSAWFHVSHGPFALEAMSGERYGQYRAHGVASGVAPATLNRRLAFLRRYARFAAETSPELGSLAAELAALRFAPVRATSERTLDGDEEERLVDAAERLGPMEHAVVTLLVRTGIRASELVEFDRGHVQGPAAAPVSMEVRGARAKLIVLPPRAARALAAWMAASPRADDRPLFSLGGEARLSTADVADVVGRSARAAGLRASPRTLRHTFAVRYLAEHADDVDGLAGAVGRTAPAVVKAWRARARASHSPLRVLTWAEADEAALDGGGGESTLSAAPFAARRRTLLPDVESRAPADPGPRVVFVLRGRASVESTDGSVVAREGDAVAVPGGAEFVLRALDGRPAVTLTVAASGRGAS